MSSHPSHYVLPHHTLVVAPQLPRTGLGRWSAVDDYCHGFLADYEDAEGRLPHEEGYVDRLLGRRRALSCRTCDAHWSVPVRRGRYPARCATCREAREALLAVFRWDVDEDLTRFERWRLEALLGELVAAGRAVRVGPARWVSARDAERSAVA